MVARTLSLALAAILLLPACPKSRRTLVPTVPTSGDASARQRFHAASQEFRRDGHTQTAAEFEAIATQYPRDPIAPYARLYAGMAGVDSGDFATALRNLEALAAAEVTDTALRARGNLYLGLALAYQRRCGEALPLLASEERAINTDAERGEWLAAMAECHVESGQPVEALGFYDAFYDLARPAERAYITARLSAIVATLEADLVSRAYAELSRRDGPVAAVLGLRYAADLTASGQQATAELVLTDTAGARERIGMATWTGGASGDPQRVGAVLPLSGRRGRVGELVMRGLVLAAGTFADAADVVPANAPRPFSLSVRDLADHAGGAEGAMAELSAAGVIAVLGPVDADSVGAAAASAEARGVPLFALDQRGAPSTVTASRYVFHVVHSAEERARALARFAVAAGKRDFAILGPRGGYGRAVGDAFKQEVERLGGNVVVSAWYDPATTSFGDTIKRLRKPWQAVFVPDIASRLELVAPALAAGNFVSRPLSSDPPEHGRKILLLSTAEFLDPSFLRSAGRYAEGAVLAPGFYPDRFDPRMAELIAHYEAAYGRLPTALEAYAYDAALVVRAAVESGARTRAEVAAYAARSQIPGLTGDIAFGATLRRRDSGVLYQVQVTERGDYAIRALR